MNDYRTNNIYLALISIRADNEVDAYDIIQFFVVLGVACDVFNICITSKAQTKCLSDLGAAHYLMTVLAVNRVLLAF